MKKVLCLMAFTLVIAAPIYPQIGIRTISSVGIDANFDGTLDVNINQVLLFPVTDWLSGEAKVQRQDTPRLRETTVSVAPIFLLGRGAYVIVRYSLGIGDLEDSDDANEAQRSIGHGLTIDANHETESLYANFAIRAAYYPQDGFWFVLPTIAARVGLDERVSLLGRYFFSYNADDTVGNAVLTEISRSIGDRWSAKLGSAASVDLSRPGGAPSSQPRDASWEFSGITGFSYAVTPSFTLRYHLEYLGRVGAADGVRNILVLDAAF